MLTTLDILALVVCMFIISGAPFYIILFIRELIRKNDKRNNNYR